MALASTPGQGLTKSERLSGKTAISELLAGKRFGHAKGIKYCFRTDNGCGYNRIMVSVGKKLFRRAVKRNLLKRRIRESYRTQKYLLPETGGVDILFIYNTKEVLSYHEIRSSVESILKTIGDGKE